MASHLFAFQQLGRIWQIKLVVSVYLYFSTLEDWYAACLHLKRNFYKVCKITKGHCERNVPFPFFCSDYSSIVNGSPNFKIMALTNICRVEIKQERLMTFGWHLMESSGVRFETWGIWGETMAVCMEWMNKFHVCHFKGHSNGWIQNGLTLRWPLR